MNIFKKIFNYLKKPKVVPETHNPFPEITTSYMLSDEYDRVLRNAGTYSGTIIPKKLPLRDSRGRFTKKEENV